MSDPRKKKQTGETLRMLFLVTQVGLCMASALAVGGLLGYGADRLFGTLPILTIVGLFLGMAAGFRSAWALVAKYTRDSQEPEKPVKDEKLAEAEKEFQRWKNSRG
ncbi:MAG: AtpZ/AtpI family protein [Lachnospiraceae bacterium]|nr:AtpZ/AtpI family protein [Lachnospiraceae bacterium]